MRILVTGSTGYLGTHISRFFLAQGNEVRAGVRAGPTDRSSILLKYLSGAQQQQLDVTNFSECKQAVKDVDLVVHTAALNSAKSAVSDDEAVAVTGLGTANMLRASAITGVKRFIYLSTFHVYGPPRGTTVNEETAAFPIHNYGISHLLAENFCLKYKTQTGLDTVVLRMSNGYGAPVHPFANCWMLAANDFARSAVLNGHIILRSAGTQKRDLVGVSDILQGVSLIASAADLGELPVYCLGGDNSLSIQELAAMVRSAVQSVTGNLVPIDFAPEVRPSQSISAGSEQPAAELSSNFCYDISKIRALGYSPEANVSDTLQQLVRFVVANKEELR